MEIKLLDWQLSSENTWIASSPCSDSRRLMVFYAQERYWGAWVGAKVEGHETLTEAMAEGQTVHNEFIQQFIK